MIIVRESARDTFERVGGDMTLLSRDGERKAPLRTILAQSWSADERAAFGIYIAEPFTVPDSKVRVGAERFERDGSVVRQVFDLTDVPGPSTADINAERDRRVASGFMFKGLLFQSRIEDQKRINGAGTLAAIAIMNGSQVGDYRWHNGASDFVWISDDNRLVRMDAFDIIAFGQAAARWESEHVFAARNLKDMVDSPKDYADDKYWPVRA